MDSLNRGPDSVQSPDHHVTVVGGHRHRLRLLEGQEASFIEDCLEFVLGSDPLAFVLERIQAIAPQIVEDKDEGLWILLSR